MMSPPDSNSPHKMILLNAKNTDMLVQLLKASSSAMTRSPGKSCKSTPKSFTRQAISREPLRQKNNDHSRKESPVKQDEKELMKMSKEFLSQSIDFSMKDTSKTTSSSLMNTLDMNNHNASSSVVNKYLQRAL